MSYLLALLEYLIAALYMQVLQPIRFPSGMAILRPGLTLKSGIAVQKSKIETQFSILRCDSQFCECASLKYLINRESKRLIRGERHDSQFRESQKREKRELCQPLASKINRPQSGGA
jgi:hypothetical protein